MNRVDKYAYDCISKLGDIYETRTDDYGNGIVEFKMVLEQNLDMTEDEKDKMSDAVYDLEKWVEDQSHDNRYYELKWLSNWYGEDVFVIETYDEE